MYPYWKLMVHLDLEFLAAPFPELTLLQFVVFLMLFQ